MNTVIETKHVKELPEDMTGHVIYFDEELNCGIFDEPKKEGNVTSFSIFPKAYVKCKYMRVRGGFGAKKELMGRMIIGDYFQTLEDAKLNKIATSGNTKEYPSGYVPELFEEEAK